MNKSQMIEKLKDYLPEKRIRHSKGVAKAAVSLAKIYGFNEEKAEIAGILHDTAKYVRFEDVEKYCEKYSIELDDMEKKSTALSHSILGRYIAEFEFGINDKEILSAIRYHTTGKPNMSDLESIIYLADMIEEGRVFEGVDTLRELAYSGRLIESIYRTMNNSIEVVIKKNAPIHMRTIEARNYYLGKFKSGEIM